MRILLVGAGGVGDAFCAIASHREFVESIVVGDIDPARAERVASRDDRFTATTLDASDPASIAAAATDARADLVMNAADPRFVMPIFDGAFAAGANYMDMAMSISEPHPDRPHELTGVKLGDRQFAKADDASKRWSSPTAVVMTASGVLSSWDTQSNSDL